MKKKRVETFRNIRYPVGRSVGRTIYIYIYIYILYRERVQVVTLGGLARARSRSPKYCVILVPRPIERVESINYCCDYLCHAEVKPLSRLSSLTLTAAAG